MQDPFNFNAGFNAGFNFGFFGDTAGEPRKETVKKKEKEPEDEPHIKVSHRMGHRNLTRRATSDIALENEINWAFEEGDCYHCFSFGDVDFLSYVKFVVRQQKVKYLALSTWCMSGEDVLEVRKWWKRKLVGRCDFYVGEIFRGSYPEAYAATVSFCRECGGRLVTFRNHAKIGIIVGERFDCLIESSANINTNPRSENTVVTVDKSLVRDYLDLFNGIQSFDDTFKDVPVYIPQEKNSP